MNVHGFLADALVVIHLAFVVFVVAGGLLAFRWPRVVWAHIPSAVWGVWIEMTGRICPLTPLENDLRARAGREPYEGDFVANYVFPVLYPESLTRDIQVVLGLGVLAVNLVIYGIVWSRFRRLGPH